MPSDRRRQRRAALTMFVCATFGWHAPALASTLTPPGDVNSTGTTNVADVQCMILVALWSTTSVPPAPTCLGPGLGVEVADLNCDGEANVVDVQAEIRIALELGFSAAQDKDGDGWHDACDPDDDNDGEPDVTDCAPLDPSLGKGGVEVCDGLDNDCDGTADVAPAGQPALCDDGNVCTTDVCTGPSGCAYSAFGGACDDDDACTVGDLCAQGVCAPGSAATCDDGNPCTTDGCAPETGCTHGPASSACDDGNVCTVGDACLGGTCVGGAAAPCDDGEPCTVDSCSKLGGCSHAPTTGSLCNDGDPCTLVDTCVAGVCTGQVAAPCDDGNPCTTDACSPASGCVYAPDDGAPCSDGDGCTGPDLCLAGACVPGEPWCGGWGGAGCFVDTDDQGCDGCGCEQCVCDADAYCCDVSWDGTCVNRCKGACGATCALSGSCCEARETPGCSSATVTTCVCNVQPECCNDVWTAACVQAGIACASGCP